MGACVGFCTKLGAVHKWNRVEDGRAGADGVQAAPYRMYRVEQRSGDEGRESRGRKCGAREVAAIRKWKGKTLTLKNQAEHDSLMQCKEPNRLDNFSLQLTV